MATRNYVLQRCMRRSPHRLVVGVPEALFVGSRLTEAAPKKKEAQPPCA